MLSVPRRVRLKRSAVAASDYTAIAPNVSAFYAGRSPAACRGSTAYFGYTFISSGGGAGGGERPSPVAPSSTYLVYPVANSTRASPDGAHRRLRDSAGTVPILTAATLREPAR